MATLHRRSNTSLLFPSDNGCRKENLASFSRRKLRSPSMQNKSSRLSWKVALAGIVACVLAIASARAQDMRTIEGQIFIRTKGGESIKLSLVDVLLFDEKVIVANLEAKRKLAKPIEDYFQPLEKLAARASSHARDVEEIVRKFKGDYSLKGGDNGKGLQEAVDAVANVRKEVLAIASKAGIPLERDFQALRKEIDEAIERQNTANEAYKRQNEANREKERRALQTAIGALDRKVSEVAGTMAEKTSQLHREISNKATCSFSANYCFSDLPLALQSTKTDADGKFGFKVPNGVYVLAAASNRSAGATVIGNQSFQKTESYHWMVKVTVNKDKTVMLANDNLASAGSDDSLVLVSDGNFTSREDIQSFAGFLEKAKREQASAEASANAASAAQRKAIELYPELGVADSLLNNEFVERVRMYRIEKKEFFAEPDWPVRLAKECSEALAAKPKAK